MLAALALLSTAGALGIQDLTPTDDIWVYGQASDQKDAYLRVWGSGGAELAASSADMEQFSYSYLRFDISKVPAGKISGAKLVLTHVANPTFTLGQAVKAPLVARPISAEFTEKTWDFGMAETIKPDGALKAIFGKGSPETLPSDDKEFTISLDLLKGPNDFASYLRNAQAAKKALAISLSSSMDVAGEGKRTFYKVFSKDADSAAKRPVLRLTVDN